MRSEELCSETQNRVPDSSDTDGIYNLKNSVEGIPHTQIKIQKAEDGAQMRDTLESAPSKFSGSPWSRDQQLSTESTPLHVNKFSWCLPTPQQHI